MTVRARAAVLRDSTAPYRLENVELPAPGAGEVLVRLVGTGLCHTDTLLRTPQFAALLPVIPGHEGAGVVEATGPGVTGVGVGDHVVLSFDSCGRCDNCRSGHPAYCAEFFTRNLTGRRQDGSTSVLDEHGTAIAGHWFGQSAFATHALATTRNVVPVAHGLPLAVLGPLGCGVLTGAGSVFTVLRPPPASPFAVFGAGTVGLSAVMAAALVGAYPIIAVDVHDSRLDLAADLGATHVVRATVPDLTATVQRLTGGGVHRALDTTGALDVLSSAIGSLTPTGVLGTVAAQAGDLAISPTDIVSGRTITAIIEGDAVPQVLVPQLIRLWEAGKLPFDRLITKYPLADVNEAERAAASGEVVKPVLVTE